MKPKNYLAGLNRAQKQAVEYIDGPLLVVAGPGTGKTELLSSRVANILAQTDVRPANILCLTFTNKAAVNMKSRIIQKVGAPGAKVSASTFHSFAAEIMNLYPDRFWNAARLKVAPDSVQLDVIESIVAKLPLGNPLSLKFAGQYTLLNQIRQAIKLTKEAGLTPDKLRAIIKANLAYIDLIEPQLVEICSTRLSAKNQASFKAAVSTLPDQPIDTAVYPLISLSTVLNDSLAAAGAQDEPTGKCANTSKWKSRFVQNVDGVRGMHTERERNHWWLLLADIYETYRSQLHSRGFYDYADMLVEVVAQLEQTPAMLADIQERFSYVLIDEFQDTTPAQMRLAHLVADHHATEGKPNLMAVGDDDQSIFKFNGAELNNMMGFKRAYPAAEIIVLRDNYRSSQALLDAAQRIISQAENRLVTTDPNLSKDLVAQAPPEAKGKIKALVYPSSELELSEVARDIQRSHKPGREIAVLARSHDSLRKMAAILQSLRVPVRYEQSSNILDHPIVSQVHLVAKLALSIQAGDRASTDGLLHQIIRSPAWGLKPQQLWELALRVKRGHWLDSLTADPHKDIKVMGNWFMALAANADAQPLAITIEQIIGLRPSGDYSSPVKNYYLKSSAPDINAYFHGLSAIQLLRSMVHDFASGTEPKLSDLVRFIDINLQNGVVVADESPFITGGHAVQLLTVHKAKGLEFDHVYIIGAVEDDWSPNGGGRKPPANLPLNPPLDDFDDYVRLMYVAATRAKSSLTISAYSQDHAGKDVAVSSIVQAAFAPKLIELPSKNKLIEVLEENLRWPDLAGSHEKTMLKARLEEYNLYATHLLDFLDVSRGGPRYFKERHLLRLPELKTPSLAYGSAMHSALEAAQLETNRGSFLLEAIKKIFIQALKEEQLPASDFERYQGKGQQTLDKLFKSFGYRLPTGSLSEQKFKNIVVGHARIGGKLDRVDAADGQVKIVDYKTGSVLRSLEAKDKASALRAYKHKLQLVFYALLIHEQQSIEPAKIEGQMVYVEAGNAGSLIKTHQPTAAELDSLRKLISAVWRKVIELDLPNTDKYPKDITGIRQFEADLIAGK